MDTNKKHQIDHLIHYTLLAGVSMSAILLMAGLFIVLVRSTPRPEVAPPLSEILRQAFMANGVDLIYMGLLLLMITPVARVMTCFRHFSKKVCNAMTYVYFNGCFWVF